ncbi:MAG: D-Ala-D-Ala carboxypeptidase family metallohydrolase [Treponema sp.]|nr:D-Ala-D-Ala carboxypeptidase family metallohydrolase [Treponema sp.]
MVVKKIIVFLVLVLIISVGSVFAQDFVVRGYDWSNPRTQISQFFTVGEVFTNGTTVDWARRDALFALPQRERDQVIDNILRMASRLDAVRTQFGPLRVNSWYRDRVTNARVGGATNSSHIDGHGVDIVSNTRGVELERWLDENWNGGVGKAVNRTSSPRGFTHVDLGRNRRWDYGTPEPR